MTGLAVKSWSWFKRSIYAHQRAPKETYFIASPLASTDLNVVVETLLDLLEGFELELLLLATNTSGDHLLHAIEGLGNLRIEQAEEDVQIPDPSSTTPHE